MKKHLLKGLSLFLLAVSVVGLLTSCSKRMGGTYIHNNTYNGKVMSSLVVDFSGSRFTMTYKTYAHPGISDEVKTEVSVSGKYEINGDENRIIFTPKGKEIPSIFTQGRFEDLLKEDGVLFQDRLNVVQLDDLNFQKKK